MNGFKLLERPYSTTLGEYFKKANYNHIGKAGVDEYWHSGLNLYFCIYHDNHRIAYCHAWNPSSKREWTPFILKDNDELFINEDCQILTISRYRIAISY